ncbi:MAG: ABC transporter permease [Bacteroidales bacterium]|nr:ABC transporter permease [Bacteroidales bacterium]MDG2080359.1 ABC transporter permease [Bacteroidales bacterium]
MNFEYFIARKLKSGDKKNLSKPVIGISTLSIALGLSLMIISVAVVVGFKNSISEKVMNFASHIQLVVFDNNFGEQGSAIMVNERLLDILNSQDEITHIQKVAHKAGIVKTKDQILGVVLKGVDSNFNKSFLESNISSGLFPAFNDSIKSNEVLISSAISRKLELKTGDDMRMWFLDEDQPRARGRKFTISGIYDTGMEEIDDVYVIGDIKHIQKLNNWDATEVGSIELMVNDIDKIRDVSFNLYTTIPYNIRSISVFEEYPQIFNWLELLDLNVIVILALLIIVSTITMISTLLILIIERTSMVGLLKALGTTNSSIRKIFLIKASGVIVKGMILGNIIGIGFYYVQSYFRIIKLSAESYYVDYVPMELHLSDVLMLNIGTFIISLLVLIIPTFYITRVMPARALRYE